MWLLPVRVQVLIGESHRFQVNPTLHALAHCLRVGLGRTVFIGATIQVSDPTLKVLVVSQ